MTRFALQEERQGEALFLVNEKKYLAEKKGSERATHHGYARFVYQRVAPQDNYRRLIGAVAPRGYYCADTVHYVSETKCQLPLDVLASIWNSAAFEWFFPLLSSNNHISQYKADAMPVPLFADQSKRKAESPYAQLASASSEASTLALKRDETKVRAIASMLAIIDGSAIDTWNGATLVENVDYLGWEHRYPVHRPDDATQAQGRWFANGVSPHIDGNGPGDIPWDLIARVNPSYPLPGRDEASWEASAWEQFCGFLSKNKTKIGNGKIRADLTGRGAITNPTGPMKRLQETFLKFHREIRENRAKAAELDFLIDRIVFKLFDLTLEEQKLILSRVGPGRPLRLGAGAVAQIDETAQPQLFGESA